MKKLVKIMGIICGVFVLLIVILLLALGPIIGSAVANAIRTQGTANLGTPVDVESVKFSLFGSSMRINKLAVANPDKTGGNLFQADSVFADVRFWPLLSGQVHIDELSSTNPTLEIKRDKQGRINLSRLKARKEATAPGEKKEPGKPEEKPKEPGDILGKIRSKVEGMDVIQELEKWKGKLDELDEVIFSKKEGEPGQQPTGEGPAEGGPGTGVTVDLVKIDQSVIHYVDAKDPDRKRLSLNGLKLTMDMSRSPQVEQGALVTKATLELGGQKETFETKGGLGDVLEGVIDRLKDVVVASEKAALTAEAHAKIDEAKKKAEEAVNKQLDKLKGVPAADKLLKKLGGDKKTGEKGKLDEAADKLKKKLDLKKLF